MRGIPISPPGNVRHGRSRSHTDHELTRLVQGFHRLVHAVHFHPEEKTGHHYYPCYCDFHGQGDACARQEQCNLSN